MSFVRLSAVVLSLMVHASIGYTMLPSLERTTAEALDLGHGTDIVLVEQGVAMEGLAKLGNDMQTIETAEVVPVEQPPPPPPQEIKPDELRDVIASDASTVEQEVVKTQEPPEQVAALEQQSSGEAKTGGDAKAFGQYLGQINEHVQKAKVNPRSRRSGTVVLRFTIGLNGQLLSKEIATSSGSKILDEAATAALDRAAPFPPIPPEVSIKPLAFTQPFKFLMR